MFKYVNFVIGVSICAPSGIVHAAECNPPQVMCGEDPYSYACPPCAPKSITSQADAESYRVAMEGYRAGIEESRSKGELGNAAYDKAIEQYKNGIEVYQYATADVRGFSLRNSGKAEDIRASNRGAAENASSPPMSTVP